MKISKRLTLVFLFIVLLFTSACSSDDDYAESAQDFAVTEEDSAQREASPSTEQVEFSEDLAEDMPTDQERRVIYTAYLDLEVKHYQQALNQIETEIDNHNGYIVTTETNQTSQSLHHGSLTARIPQASFQTFLTELENEDITMTHRQISGEDVTERYIDLESRLQARELVEERLLSFMDEAETTEDLLQISSDLADVQVEIEQIKGQMNYLENKSDLATVTINISENRVDLVGEENLDTWERTEQQFMKSVNFILSASSSLVVFTIGNIPILLIVGVILLVVHRFFITRRNDNREES